MFLPAYVYAQILRNRFIESGNVKRLCLERAHLCYFRTYPFNNDGIRQNLGRFEIKPLLRLTDDNRHYLHCFRYSLLCSDPDARRVDIRNGYRAGQFYVFPVDVVSPLPSLRLAEIERHPDIRCAHILDKPLLPLDVQVHRLCHMVHQFESLRHVLQFQGDINRYL